MKCKINKCFAHSENNDGQKHSLSRHLYDTAERIDSFACHDKYKRIFFLTGLLHDLGKYQPEFQKYLESGGGRGSVPHSSWGAGYARRYGLLEASFAIDGHHKGLPDTSSWKSDTEPFKRNDVREFEDVINTFLNDTGFNEMILKEIKPILFADPLHREVFMRYLFSALTDSDWLSTEQHFNKDAYGKRISTMLPIEEMVVKLDEEFFKKSKVGEINVLRNETRLQVLRKAGMPCGFYSLAIPTGLGKTLTSMAWALEHARKNDLKRIIIVLPYINIIDQTAQTLKSIFGEEWVLEHHSSYNGGDDSEKNEQQYSIDKIRKALACENWDYPIIITTTVQFFESLFSNKPSRCRKIHNIAESIVIFDEVQTLPKEIILPTLQMLKDVQIIMRSSFLFCTATQPAFEKRIGFEGIDLICPLVDNTSELYEKTKRVEYRLLNDLNPIDCGLLFDAVRQEDNSALIIFNTKKSALKFFEHTKGSDLWDTSYHLSTAMCPSHRKEVIRSIWNDLELKKKILVASTQLIEAGVDFDFPVVFRAIAPLEAVIQSAGRCNREGKLGKSGGRVFLFKLQDSGMPDKTYAACAVHTEELIKLDIDQLHNHDLFNKYYSQIISLYVDPDCYKINEARGQRTGQFNFKIVNDAYRIIRDLTEGLFIYNCNEESRELLHSIEYKEFLSREDYRKMQAYTVQVYKHFIIQNSAMCKIMPQGFMVWYGNYHNETGLSVLPMEADKLVL